MDATERRMPVVLLHGALRSRIGLLPTAAWLDRRGLQTRVFGYRTRRGTLDDHARSLAAFLDAWIGDRPTPVLGFLTHSMGGLVVRAYLARYGDRHASRQRIVMLSPPNRGSSLAIHYRANPLVARVYGDALAQLDPDNAARLPPPPATASVLVLAGGRGDPRGYNPRLMGDDDGVVALSDMPLAGSTLRHVGGVHSMLQWRPRVLAQALAFLTEHDERDIRS